MKIAILAVAASVLAAVAACGSITKAHPPANTGARGASQQQACGAQEEKA